MPLPDYITSHRETYYSDIDPKMIVCVYTSCKPNPKVYTYLPSYT